MCREFVLKHPLEELQKHFGFTESSAAFAPSYGVRAGSQIVTLHAQSQSSTRTARALRWGLTPFWRAEDDRERRIINARAETLHLKPAFRDSLVSRRCIVPASGFFEWTSEGGERVPLYVHSKNDAPLGIAALWDEWVTPAGEALHSCALVTTESNRVLSPHHARMPAILHPEDYTAWLDPAYHNIVGLRKLLQPYTAKQTALHKVSPETWKLPVNDARRLEAVGEYSNELPAVKKRQVMRDFVTPDGQVFFTTRSFTRDDYTRWHPVVDLGSGHVWCDCPDFRFRHATHEPDMLTPQHWCKHVARAVGNCRRHGELALYYLTL
jgi:putative SOS response-associated peptidase YedK